jgi:hypothetical protein
MVDSVEMDEVGTQGQGGRQDQDQERDTPWRNDEQDQGRPSQQDQPGARNRDRKTKKRTDPSQNDYQFYITRQARLRIMQWPSRLAHFLSASWSYRGCPIHLPS